MFGLLDSDLQIIKDTLSHYPEVEIAVIYGSRAMGNYKPGSDVDIALKGAITFDTVTKISWTLNEELPLPYRFDVVAYGALTNDALISHIDYHGKVFYSKKTC
ncbi:MAG: nucleotidyltransferase domain-containing protein [Verrucomicrobiota bacterium]|nr:nucleotidyltransferase domain-containing protein [Verrucomicrobiota bacterium]